ncbi:U4/U6.U5 small nuclear ribonucleoprotein 27 kDa protein [Cylas formicarius]|uniref:U4/U6.U5 small nuclear ribonucleoprotein 27 kDa protein n=1 Tax=Cylas formicarius TaxID=197179 RepID=UPI002958738E|nr:U4/U6.U5 small nuclear ribonucleoprotein 27 kDa protein [Cylas formicarius]
MGRRSRSKSPFGSRRRDRERDKERDKDREWERDRDRGRRKRSRDRSRERDRERRRHSHERRRFSRSRSRSIEKRSKPLPERPAVTAADLEGKSQEEQEMMKLMGFCNFDTTKGKKVDGNEVGEVHVILKRKYRQYMNRKGGFNRPLDFVA